MTEQGFIKLHRSILDWEWFEDEKTFKVFIYLLLNAQWEDSRYKGYEVPRGSLIIGYNALSKKLNISVRSVRTAISHLKSTGELTIKTTNKFSIVTIVNWEKYQCRDFESDKQNDKQTDIQSTFNRHASDNIKEYKEYKNIRNEEWSVADCEAIQMLFNDLCPNFAPCRNLTKTRLDKIRQLLSEFSLAQIQETFDKANKSDWLLGINDRGWKAGFDWIIEIDNFVKITDGNFDNSIKLVKNEKKSHYDFEAIERETRERNLRGLPG